MGDLFLPHSIRESSHPDVRSCFVEGVKGCDMGQVPSELAAIWKWITGGIQGWKIPDPWEWYIHEWLIFDNYCLGFYGALDSSKASLKNILLGGWTNPVETYARQIGSFPQGSG